jgi:hypothetical protein
LAGNGVCDRVDLRRGQVLGCDWLAVLLLYISSVSPAGRGRLPV